ncbi:MAG: XRE family transcriptional regulator, partial [Oscillospiraceae bacterium]|nr:XRE family transcriptional regulator [Oscillospiraceae bacterium]
MNYEIRHYDTPLLRFSATEDTARPEIGILWVNDDARQLIPLDLNLSPEGVASWLSHRTIPKNRAYVHNFLSKCGLNINRPMSIVRVS